jgi:hypothetical protein
MMQRVAQYNPPGLFRNVSFHSIDALSCAIETDFDAMFDEGRHEFVRVLGWGDWRLDCKIHGMTFHTGIPSAIEPDSQAWKRKSAESLAGHRFMKAKLLAELNSGEKIFVLRFPVPVPEDEIRRLHAAIRRRGPGWLLYVVEDPSRPLAWAERRDDRLIFGGMAQLWHGLHQNLDVDSWSAILRAALTLVVMDQATATRPISNQTA